MESSALTAVGVWFYSLRTQRYLYLMRRDVKNPDTWGLPGGKTHVGETLLQAIYRECQEEIGMMPDYIKLVPLEQFTSPNGQFHYHTFFCCVADEFVPKLNEEHLGYAWIDCNTWPKPMHPGLWSMVNFDAVKNKIDVIREKVYTSQ